jgi:cytochrome c oxidase cbb3-type subunit 1
VSAILESAPTKFELSSIDRSVRTPVLLFFGSAVLWLVLASLFFLLSSSQIHKPDAWWTFPGIPWLSYGRVYPAFLNCFVYGWIGSAGIAFGLWLLSRFSAAPFRHPVLSIYGWMVWNVGLTSGIVCLLAGTTTGRPLLEFPPYAAFIVFLGFAMVGLSAISIASHRKPGALYISEWYVIGALLWFAWMYTTANITLGDGPAPGVAQPAINWWYAGSLFDLWLTPIALGAAFYLIPKIVGRPIYSERLALLGFWGLALFGGWTGMTHIIGGPLPAWMITAGIVARILMLIPVCAIAVNFHRTMKGAFEGLRDDVALRFISTGAMIYTAYAVEGSIVSLRSVAQFTQFTLLTQVHTQLGLIGFVSLILFGVIYYIVPRLLGRQWLFQRLVTAHFWFLVTGLGLLYFSLTMGGLIQGFGLADSQVPLIAISDLLQPFLTVQNVGVLLVVIGNFTFAIAFLLILLISAPAKWREVVVGEPEKAPENSAAEVSVA